MVRQLKLSQRQAVCLAHHLRSFNILVKDVKVYGYQNRQEEPLDFFEVNNDNTFAYCKNITGLMRHMNCEYNPEQWRLFIDSSKYSLKAVLLYIDNTINPVPIALSSNTKETYESTKLILDSVQYMQHQWKIIVSYFIAYWLTDGIYEKYVLYLSLGYPMPWKPVSKARLDVSVRLRYSFCKC